MKLNEMYASNKFECAIIYGRRRVGKTTLIKEFTRL
jgi:AAA+ ATPase superfamily predicted ATPase